jgi:molybdenum cofactor cytidylyltransferase
MSRWRTKLIERQPFRASVAGIVLASGLSKRLSGGNKLLLRLGGRSIVHRTVAAYVDAGLDPVLVVTGFQEAEVRAAVADLRVRCVSNPDYAQGQSRGLHRGILALPHAVSAAVIGVGDQPLLTPAVISDLVRTFARTDARLVVPRFGGRRGNPVLFRNDLFEELLLIEGDVGGRPVIEEHAGEIHWVDVDSVAEGVDVDTREEYDALSLSFQHEGV